MCRRRGGRGTRANRRPGRAKFRGLYEVIRHAKEDPARCLASYARPLFVRIQPEIEITGTFKHRKIDLVSDGFSPDVVAVPLYWLKPSSERYEPLGREDYAAIVSGAVKV